MVLFDKAFEDIGPLYWVFIITTVIPYLSICWRRLHDIGKSGANVFWCLTIIGAIPVLIWLCQDSSRGDNQYGANPKGLN